MDALAEEARIFTQYLIGKHVSVQAIQLYAAAMHNSRPDDNDKKLLRFMVAHPSSIGLIDAGLVFHSASSETRRRLYVMFAILEASPDYYDSFLAKERGPFYLAVVAYSGMRAVIKAGLGLLLVKVIT